MNTWELHVAQISMKGVQTNMGVKELEKVLWKVPKETHIMLEAKTFTDSNKKNPLHQTC